MLCIFERKNTLNLSLFLKYVIKKYEKEQELFLYRLYVTDSLKLVAENTAKLSQGGYLVKRYAELIDIGKRDVAKEEKTPEEIIGRIKNKLRGGEKRDLV